MNRLTHSRIRELRLASLRRERALKKKWITDHHVVRKVFVDFLPQGLVFSVFITLINLHSVIHLLLLLTVVIVGAVVVAILERFCLDEISTLEADLARIDRAIDELQRESG